jgi:hypothetical protein
LDNQHEQLVSLYEEIKRNALVSLEKGEITKVILLRMKAYYYTQKKIKEFLNKRYLPAAFDFFVETIPQVVKFRTNF